MSTVTQAVSAERTAFRVLAAISFCHFLNDMLQSVIPALYPILKESYRLDFSQIGLITLTGQAVASLLQPVVGYYTDRNPQPWSLAFGMVCTMTGISLLSIASSFGLILIAVAVLGFGSAIFHPESSRIARKASGGQHGLAQSLFQVGGNAGSATGPLLAAFVVMPRGQGSVAWFALAALAGIALLTRIGFWYRARLDTPRGRVSRAPGQTMSRARIALAVGVLLMLIFSKYFYMASLTTYYTFYLINKFGVSVQHAQVMLFFFLGAVAAGTIIGGPVGDRIGRRYVIWVSILGVLPFSLILPWANLFWTGVLSVIIGLVLASAFSAILVYAQELLPGNIGMISGLFFGFAFGMGGLGAAVLGKLADATSVTFVYQVCAWLPAIGLLTAFLPDTSSRPPVTKTH